MWYSCFSQCYYFTFYEFANLTFEVTFFNLLSFIFCCFSLSIKISGIIVYVLNYSCSKFQHNPFNNKGAILIWLRDALEKSPSIDVTSWVYTRFSGVWFSTIQLVVLQMVWNVTNSVYKVNCYGEVCTQCMMFFFKIFPKWCWS